jgi:endonuclease/exonuclease/phosphatase family metal-dependent hydrolase
LREQTSIAPSRWRLVAAVVLAALMAATAMVAAPQADAKKKSKSVQVKVMTRNIFLGADLGPGLEAGGLGEFVVANGGILREVDETNFPLRAKGLAGEVKQKKPDLIGLQEVALWRTGPFNVDAALDNAPVATDVKYDFLDILLDELEAKGLSYKPAVVKEEFDFEAPADYDNNPATGTLGAEINGRLTMRDVILVNKDSKVDAKLKNPQTGTFSSLYTPIVGGILPVPVTRGWTAGDVTVSKGKGKDEVTRKFRFVNSHFEAFDDETEVPSIRAQQAAQLLAEPADKKKTIILGDFNSDVATEVQAGDAQAYQALLDGGFTERSTSNPLSCCVSDLFTSPPSEFDHQVDHIMTNRSKGKVKLVNSSVTGLEQVNGVYNSDHAGVFSTLKLK